MTTMLVIALGHAAFPVAGSILKGKAGLCAGAVAGAAIAVCLGGPRYALFDLIGVGIGIAIGVCILKNNDAE